MEIWSIRHKGLLRFFEHNDGSGLPAARLSKIRSILTALSDAADIRQVETMPGWRLHPLKGNRSGGWAISLSGNWRITFFVRDKMIHELNLEDYH